MASTGQKWAVGCGIGCLVILIALGGVGTCAFFGVKQMVGEAEKLEVHLDELRDRFGEPDSFVPEPGPAISPVQVDAFLTVRDGVRSRGADLREHLHVLEHVANPVAKLKSGMAIVPAMIQFVGHRAAVLVEQGMHPGEYAHLYALVYFAWLGHDPGDGPNFRISGDDDDQGFRWSGGEGGSDIREDRAYEARRNLNRLQRAILANQLEAQQQQPDADPAWTAALEAEIAALGDDRRRLAWEDGLPEEMAASLAPFRDELSASYDELLNAMETAVLEDDGPSGP
jgi:hypothetical protein